MEKLREITEAEKEEILGKIGDGCTVSLMWLVIRAIIGSYNDELISRGFKIVKEQDDE